MSDTKKTPAKKASKENAPDLTPQAVESAFWDYVLEHGKKPASVYSLCKKMEIEEKAFYQVYPA